MSLYESIKGLIEEGVIHAKGEGRTDERQWLLIHTAWGDVVYKEFWTGPGLAVDTEISTDASFSDSTLEVLAEAAGLLWNEKNPTIDEPPAGKRFVHF